MIVPFDFTIGYKLLEQRCGHTPDTIREKIRVTGLVPKFETGLIGSREFVETLCQEIGVALSYSEFSHIWSSIFSRKLLIPESFLEALHERYRLVLVSNTNALHFEMIESAYSFLKHFDSLILSYKVRAMKPSPIIFQAALAAADAAAEQCFFTDDIQEYVEGAQALGIDAVPFSDFETLKTQLASRGVLWGD